jgi:hypothetical protein
MVLLLVAAAFVVPSLYPEESGEAPWIEVHLKSSQSLWASSELADTAGGQGSRYSVHNLFDRNGATCWAEGREGDGIGEKVYIVVNRHIEGIGIVNGYVKNTSTFKKNNRLKRAKISLFIAFNAPGMVTELDYYLYLLKTSLSKSILLRDTADRQYFQFPFSEEEQQEFRQQGVEAFRRDYPQLHREIVKELGIEETEGLKAGQADYENYLSAYSIYGWLLEIEEVYAGSTFRDTCISEIDVTSTRYLP